MEWEFAHEENQERAGDKSETFNSQLRPPTPRSGGIHIIPGGVRSKKVLLVEDCPSDVRLFHEALEGRATRPILRLASDGEDALKALFKDQDEPDLIILDLNLPKVSGYEVLRRVKESPLQHIPIVVFSSAPNREAPPYADAYIKKPLSLDEYLQVVRRIFDDWLVPTHHLPAPL